MRISLYTNPKDGAVKLFRLALICFSLTLVMSACTFTTKTSEPQSTASITSSFSDWINIKMTDVRTGKAFTVSDFAGKVVLIETMAEWCPNCIFQQAETRKMSKQLGNPEDLILISLDVDLNEDETSLKKYTEDFGFEWRFAVAPMGVQRALGNLYSAEYHNPPLEPMLLFDRQGNAHQLEYGMKEAATLQKLVEPYLMK